MTVAAGGRGVRAACDTSVAVAALDPNHEAHTVARRAVLLHRPALAGHAAFELHAVLTRLPFPLRLSPVQASEVSRRAFPQRCWLTPAASEDLLDRAGVLGLVGGAVYDALVGAAAAADGRLLLTRDRRASRTYASLGVEFELLD